MLFKSRMFESVQVKPLCCWYTGSEGWFYTGNGLSVTCMQMYEHEVGVMPAVEFPEQSRNFARIPGISHEFQEFRTHSRRIAHERGFHFHRENFREETMNFIGVPENAFQEILAFIPGI